MHKNSAEQFMLNSDVLKYLPFDKYYKDFTFIVNNKEYKTSRIVADILSPLIRKYHMTDETIDHFTIDASDMKSESDFSEILSLVNFNNQEISEQSLEYYRKIFFLLGNDDEFIKLYPQFSGQLTTKNVINIINDKQRCLCQRPELLPTVSRSEIEFISGHFYEIDQTELKKLGIDMIEAVLKSKSLKIENEDSLLKFLIEIYKEDKRSSFLFDSVIFENVSDECLVHFFESFDIDDIDSEVWKMIVYRSLKLNAKTKSSEFDKRYRIKETPFLYEKGKEFNGIVKHLTEETGGNIHKNGTIEVSSNRYSSGWEPWNLLDFDKDNGYSPCGEWDCWVCYDFKEKKVQITNYTINSVKGNRSSHHLKSWVVEVSEDGNDWKTIDEQKESQKLNGTNLVATFGVNSNGFSRYVRLRNTAEPWGGNNLWFSCLEFYGYIQYETK